MAFTVCSEASFVQKAANDGFGCHCDELATHAAAPAELACDIARDRLMNGLRILHSIDEYELVAAGAALP